ncbi:G-protein coupled receptor 161-like, partial [Stylophora pistillata]|uniref:G-protein coupled receptor 161-like n=1 Tax=Stylophora pistillata TaxID=50429 RepID=UPI000C0396F1
LFYPLEMTKSRAICLCFVLWIYSAIWAFLPLFGVSSYECFITYIGTCKAEDWSKYGLNFAFAISVVSGTYGLALLTMVFVYWKIARVIRSQLQRIEDVTSNKKKQQVYNKEDITAGKLKRSKGVVTLMIVTLVYLICWSPFCILLFVEIGKGRKVEGPYGALAMLVGFTNSCCNPIIYSIKYRRFRKAVFSMIGKTDFVMRFSVTNNAGMSSMVQEYTVKRVQILRRRESSP